MEFVMNTTLVKWGNSQGFRISREVCDMLGIRQGSKAVMSVDAPAGCITLQFQQSERHYSRSRRVSMEELCEGWSGPKVGAEWSGGDVGSEVVE